MGLPAAGSNEEPVAKRQKVGERVEACDSFLHVQDLLDSSDLLPSYSCEEEYEFDEIPESKIKELQNRLARDGYLYIPKFLQAEIANDARDFLLKFLEKEGLLVDGETENALAKDPEKPAGLLHRQDAFLSPFVRGLTEDPRLFTLARVLLGDAHTPCYFDDSESDQAEVGQEENNVSDEGIEMGTFQYKWLRGVQRGGFTGIHTDRAYLGSASTSRVLTFWQPIGTVPKEQGVLVVSPGAHKNKDLSDTLFKGLRKHEVGEDGVESGLVSRCPQELEEKHGNIFDWRSSDMNPGDVVILTPDCLHMSSRNVTNKYRLSVESRWQYCHEPPSKRFGKLLPQSKTFGANLEDLQAQ